MKCIQKIFLIGLCNIFVIESVNAGYFQAARNWAGQKAHNIFIASECDQYNRGTAEYNKCLVVRNIKNISYGVGASMGLLFLSAVGTFAYINNRDMSEQELKKFFNSNNLKAMFRFVNVPELIGTYGSLLKYGLIRPLWRRIRDQSKSSEIAAKTEAPSVVQQ